MSTTTATRAREIPQTPPGLARQHLAAEYAALTHVVDALSPVDWGLPTDCTGWTVRDMVAHIAGAAECGARNRVLLRHYGPALAKSLRAPQTFVDHMCASQIADRADLSEAEIAADLRRWAALAPERIEATPKTIRGVRMPSAAGMVTGATLGYLMDVISTRDVWMHRIDIARALGAERPVTVAESEAVRQVVRDLDVDWSGPPVELTLTGPGGGRWRIGEGRPRAAVSEEAVAYLRLLSGRSDEWALEGEGDPAGVAAVRAARVVF